ncbi:glutamate--cysteine ligase EgtA [Rhizocola hellebori]|uniref:Glutamate--cysteine ligase EgtA n=1 Tax=Rhizocola hellebori TaxID=1392758 RepID=A0A8J3Q8G9_9ACTN|nr:glutamate-cysteine ligase family protein [Rhizocola hellebori]GIH05168.1 glutamate--cysteine ligase EgtA [Rhizocola hellebori]
MLKDEALTMFEEPVTCLADAEGYIVKVCFKTGPPTRIGAELEWNLHRSEDSRRPVTANLLRVALGDHCPTSLRPHARPQPLPRGGLVTIEPGGQVEISTQPSESLAELINDTCVDIGHLRRMLAAAGLRMSDDACDLTREPLRMLDSPRYRAMEQAFDRIGPFGRTMMCSTAGLQVCLDAGTEQRVAARWNALHILGPALIALFANSPGAGWASHRMQVWYGTDPIRTCPPADSADPVAAWARRVLHTPLLCLRRPDDCWTAPPKVTFADWIAGAIRPQPTYDDLDYHLSTIFAPVRARGYLEVRYLDAQPGTDWMLATTMLAALFAQESTVDEAAAIAAPAAGRWASAAQLGLADPAIAVVVPALLALTCRAIADTDLSADTAAWLAERLRRKAGDLL